MRKRPSKSPPQIVVQLISSRQRRGAEVFAAELSTMLVARGHAVHFAGLNPPPAEPLAPENVTSDDVSDTRPSVLSPRIVSDLTRYLRRIQPDVIQANGGYAMKYAVLAKRWSQEQWPILYCNIGLSSDWLRKPGQRMWNRWLLRQAAATAAVSEASRADLLNTYGLDPASVKVVRRGVPTDVADPLDARRRLRRELGIAEDAHVLLHVGSFSPEKNHEGLLRIVDRVRADQPDIQLVLVGDGPRRVEVEAQAARQGGVHLLGVRNDVPHLMAGANLLLLPSLTEGIPGVILEAGVQSLPTVAYDVGGVAEAIHDGKTGRLIPSGDETTFARAVVDLLSDASKRRAVGERARAFIESDYSLERSVDSFERLYHRIVNRLDTPIQTPT